MTKAFIYVFSWWRKGKEKWCTEGKSQTCGFCRCGCMHLFLLADFKRVGAGFFPWDWTVYPQMPEKEGRMPLSSDLLTRREKLGSVHCLPSSPLTPWNTPYCQHIHNSGSARFEMSRISWLDNTKWSWTPEKIIHGKGLRASCQQAQAPVEVFTAQIFNRAMLAR